MNTIKVLTHLIATDSKLAPIGQDARGKLFGSTINLQPFHLYYTSDEEIKEGDWFVSMNVSNIVADVCHATKLVDGKIYSKTTDSYYVFNGQNSRKIVATTNPELWDNYSKPTEAYTGVPPRKSVVQWPQNSVPKISPEDIEAYIHSYNSGSPIKELLLEIEADYQPHPDNDGSVTYKGNKLKLTSSGCVISHPVENTTITWDLRQDIANITMLSQECLAKFDSRIHPASTIGKAYIQGFNDCLQRVKELLPIPK